MLFRSKTVIDGSIQVLSGDVKGARIRSNFVLWMVKNLSEQDRYDPLLGLQVTSKKKASFHKYYPNLKCCERTFRNWMNDPAGHLLHSEFALLTAEEISLVNSISETKRKTQFEQKASKKARTNQVFLPKFYCIEYPSKISDTFAAGFATGC